MKLQERDTVNYRYLPDTVSIIHLHRARSPRQKIITSSSEQVCVIRWHFSQRERDTLSGRLLVNNSLLRNNGTPTECNYTVRTVKGP